MVSNPFCMHTSKVRTSKPWSIEWLYNIGLASRIKQYIVEHNLALSKHAELDMAAIAQSTTIEHLDERVVCKLFGYKTAEEYYTAASSMQFIPQIHTPSLFLIAEDDPFLGRLPVEVSSVLVVFMIMHGYFGTKLGMLDHPAAQVTKTHSGRMCGFRPCSDFTMDPLQECKANENTFLAVTQKGGHVAFLQGLWPFGTAWMDRVAIQFFTTCSNMPQTRLKAAETASLPLKNE